MKDQSEYGYSAPIEVECNRVEDDENKVNSVNVESLTEEIHLFLRCYFKLNQINS